MENISSTGGINTRLKIGVSHAPGVVLLILGAAALITAAITTSNVMAFIGLGLTFWGAILLYIQTSDQVPTSILDASLSPYTDALNQMIQALNYKGNPIVLPPKHFENPEETAIFIPKMKDGPCPTPEQTQQNKNQTLVSDPPGILFTPPGAELTRLFEKTLETNFTTVDLKYLQQHLPRLLIEELEIATSFEMQTQNTGTSENKSDTISPPKPADDTINVTITTTAYPNTFKQAAQHPDAVALINPLTSAIACAIAKATGKPISVASQLISKEGTTLTVKYRVELEPTPS